MEMSTAKAALMQGEEIELNDIDNEEWDVEYDRKPAKVKQYRCYIIIAKPQSKCFISMQLQPLLSGPQIVKQRSCMQGFHPRILLYNHVKNLQVWCGTFVSTFTGPTCVQEMHGSCSSCKTGCSIKHVNKQTKKNNEFPMTSFLSIISP